MAGTMAGTMAGKAGIVAGAAGVTRADDQEALADVAARSFGTLDFA